MTADEYVPSVKQVRDEWISAMTTEDPDNYWDAITDEEAKGRFDRFLARVRRDAVQQFIEACKAKRDEPGFLLPRNHWQDIKAAIRVAESYIKNHPEETP